MKQITKSIFISAILAGVALVSFADRGIRKKAKARVTLNVPQNNFRQQIFDVNSGLRYKGSLLVRNTPEQSYLTTNTLVTYQKGNTVYILPYKQKVLVPEMAQGYTGMKLIIKPR